MEKGFETPFAEASQLLSLRQGDAIPFSIFQRGLHLLGEGVDIWRFSAKMIEASSLMFLDPDKKIDKHRVNLPHWQQGETWLFVTWRLADSLPEAVVRKLDERRKQWEAAHPKPWSDEERNVYNRLFTLAFESLLDDAHGSCVLGNPAMSRVVGDALLHFHGERYVLDRFVVMPNHVHVLFQSLGEHKLADIVGSWKRFTSREINKALGREGALWQREYWDRLVRSERHFQWARDYIDRNPENLRPGTFRLWQYGEGV
jgi:hypothetical protein